MFKNTDHYKGRGDREAEKLGFKTSGNQFEEAGIVHSKMVFMN